MTKELRILILEDRPADAELILRELRKARLRFAAKRVASEADFLAQLRDAPPDLILADYSLPAYDGRAALASAQRQCPNAPFIFVSGTLGEEAAIEALHHGATDYVLKQRLSRLQPAVRRALRETETRAQRQQAEAALRSSEQNYREMFNATNDAIFLHDAATGAILDVNQTALDMFGYSREELLSLTGDGFRAGEPFSYREAVRRIRQAAAEGPQVFEWQSNRKNGELFWTEVALRGTSIRGKGCVLAVVRDITQRKSAERALAESLGLRKAILENIPDPAWLKDPQGRFLACNESLAQRYGRKIEDILGKTVFDTMPSEAERMTREDQEVIVTRNPVHVEKPIIDALGQKRWFDTIKSPIFNERGEVTGIVGIARDTTERRQTDEALRVSEERFRSVWERSIDGMRLTDHAGRILAVNDAFCRLVKLPREKLIGEVFSVAYYEGQGLDEDLEVYQRRFEAGTIAPRLRTHVRLWNSEELDVAISSSFTESGRQGKTLLSIFRDITERKRAEARVAAFSHLGQRLSAAKSIKEAAEIIVEVADQLLRWDACTFDLYSPELDRLYHVLIRDTINGRRVDCAPVGDNAPPPPRARRVIETGGLLVLKDEPVMSPDAEPFGDTARPSASILTVSIRAGAEVVGVLSIHSYTLKAYDHLGLETLQMLADHCAGALKRISAQEALGASEANYRSLVERSPDAIFLHREGKFVYANPAALKLLGAAQFQQILGRSVFDIVPPENRDPIRQRIQQATEGGRPPLLEQQIVRLDGTAFEAEAVSIPLIYEGRPAVQTIMRDITERKNSDRRVAAFSNLGQKLSAAKTAREAGEIIVDVADQLLGWDACTFGLYSSTDKLSHNVLNRDTVDGRRIESQPAYDHSPPSPLARRAIEEGGQLILKEQPDQMTPGTMPFGDKTHPSASILFVPVRDGSNTIGFLSIQSYTPRAYDQHSLDTLQALADHCAGALNRITTEETLRTAQQQLRQSQKMEAVGQLAGGVAHDFNNLLAVIRGNAELLLMGGDQFTAETTGCLKHVVAAAERAANLTRQLLAFSRKQLMQSQPLLLNDVIGDLTKMLHRVIREDIRLQCNYAPRLPFVQADAGMIEQVLLNLVVNARDAMPRGGQVLITTDTAHFDAAYAQTHPEAGAGEFVCLTVSDTGTGIAPEHLPRIFEPFFTTKELGKGTGLGLATVYGIVKQHGGWIEVSSPLGAGATFKVFLPAIATPAQTAATPQAEAGLPGGTETILLVEDDYAVRVITRRVLESHGYKVCEAASAPEALELWRSRAQEITLLLSDIVMPEGVTGRELAEQLRARRPALKVILMSGYSAEVVGKDTDFFRRSKTDFLQKPCSSRALLEAVRHCLDGH